MREETGELVLEPGHWIFEVRSSEQCDLRLRPSSMLGDLVVDSRKSAPTSEQLQRSLPKKELQGSGLITFCHDCWNAVLPIY